MDNPNGTSTIKHFCLPFARDTQLPYLGSIIHSWETASSFYPVKFCGNPLIHIKQYKITNYMISSVLQVLQKYLLHMFKSSVDLVLTQSYKNFVL